MARFWQYQGSVEPVVYPVPSNKQQFPDSYGIQPPDPVRIGVRILAAAALSLAFVLVGPMAPAESVTLDKWYVQTSEPVRRLDLRAHLTEGFTLTLDKSQRPESVFPDKYWVQPSEPVRSVDASILRQLGGEYPRNLYPIPQPPDLPQMDKWFQRPPDPMRGFIRLIAWQEGLLAPKPVEVVTLDKWYVQPSEPVRTINRYTQHLGDYQLTLDKLQRIVVPPVSSWYVQPSEPQRRVSIGLTYLGGMESRIDRYPTPLSWYTQASEPVRILPRGVNYTGYESRSFILPGIVTLDRWYQPIVQPVRLPARMIQVQESRSYVLAVPPETVTMDKWFRQASDPIRKRDVGISYLYFESRLDLYPTPLIWRATIPDPTRIAIPLYLWIPETRSAIFFVPPGPAIIRLVNIQDSVATVRNIGGTGLTSASGLAPSGLAPSAASAGNIPVQQATSMINVTVTIPTVCNIQALVS